MAVSIKDTGKRRLCSDRFPVIGRSLFSPVFIIGNIIQADIGCQNVIFSPVITKGILCQKLCEILQFLRRTDLIRRTFTSVSAHKCKGGLPIYRFPDIPMLMFVFLQNAFFLHRIICFDKRPRQRSQNAEAEHCCYPFLFHLLLLV